MPSVVMEGRRVVNNIQRSASLFLVKNIFLPVVLILCSADDYLLSDGTIPDIANKVCLRSRVPGFFLAFQPNKEKEYRTFPTNVSVVLLQA